MITVKGEIGKSDSSERERIEKTFSSLQDLWEYLFNHVHGILASRDGLGNIDLGICYADLKADIVRQRSFVGAIEAGCVSVDDTRLFIHEIDVKEGVIFSDGLYTEGYPHASRDYRNWATTMTRYMIDTERDRFRFVP